MNEPQTQRRFEDRFLDGFDRSRIRQEVLRAKKKNFGSLKKRYATLMLGATLAIGGVGIPMKASKMGQAARQKPVSITNVASGALVEDLTAARDIARQVASGVTGAADAIAAPLRPAAAEKTVSMVSEAVKEEFFRKEVPFGALIYQEAKHNNLKPELVAAVVQTESRFNPTARSHMGAQGLMQLVPRTGKWMGAKNLMNPADNVKAGTKYLKYLNERFDGDETKVIAAYNAGEGNVRRFGGVPPFKETKSYLKKVRSASKDFENRALGNVSEILEKQTVAAVN